MKKLVTVSGTPVTTGDVVKDAAFQLGKLAVIWIGANIATRVAYKAIEQKYPPIDWSHPAFKTLK